MSEDRPLFIPLRREWFEAFERGEKTEEWRRLGPRWNLNTCRPGREVVLSLGYGGTRRLSGRLLAIRVRDAIGPAADLYGEGVECIILKIELTPR